MGPDDQMPGGQGPDSGGQGTGPGSQHHQGHQEGQMPHHGSGDGTPSEDGSGSVDEWLADVSNYTEVIDRTGQSEVTVQVGAQGNGGGFAYEPPAIRISPETTITWEWTGDGGSHDVVALDGRFESDLTAQPGVTFRQTFETSGTSRYYCTPHRSFGMKGVIVVVGIETANNSRGRTSE